MAFLSDISKKQQELIRILVDLWQQRERQTNQREQELNGRISELLESKSWRVTAPLRVVHETLFQPDELEVGPVSVSDLHPPNPVSSIHEIAASLFSKDVRLVFDSIASVALQSFLNSRSMLRLPFSQSPDVSVLIVLHNRAELTLQCLRSLLETPMDSLEVVLVDNGSSDQTGLLLNRLVGARIMRNAENLHFVRGANQAAALAKGKYLLFINNDTQLLPGSIKSALETIKGDGRIAAVGGKLIQLDGRLQEAGSIIWQDGSCLAYGRGEDPFAPEYMHVRDVDFCSGAFLLTQREIFQELGGFDEAYKPAYYEDADYCVRLWKQGLRVVFDPDAIVLHHEFGSSVSRQDGIQLQIRNRQTFLAQHSNFLQNQFSFSTNNLLTARSRDDSGRRVLMIDDHVPHRYLGSGFPRANEILSSLLRLNYFVTLYPTVDPNEDWSEIYRDIPREIEIMRLRGTGDLEGFLRERRGFYDSIFVSRPQNMKLLESIRKRDPTLLNGLSIVYDAEALFALRDLGSRRLRGETISGELIDQEVAKEINLASMASRIISVCPGEKDMFVQHGLNQVSVLGFSIGADPTPASFNERSGFLFVGAIHDEHSPNTDSVLWFAREILPTLQQQLGSSTSFTVVGLNHSKEVAKLADCGVILAGIQEDLTPFYQHARVFVAPTRFSAGLPMKVCDAAARGVPVVATSLLAGQLRWQDGTHLLVADDTESFTKQCIRLYSDPELWNRIRTNALERIRSECSPEAFDSTLRKILSREA